MRTEAGGRRADMRNEERGRRIRLEIRDFRFESGEWKRGRRERRTES